MASAMRPEAAAAAPSTDGEAPSADEEAPRRGRVPRARRFLRKHLKATLAIVATAILASCGEKIADHVETWFRPSFVQLVWVPADCPGGGGVPNIGMGSCQTTKNLQWLRDEFGKLRDAKVRGFDGIPTSATLEPKTFAKVKNNALAVVSGAGETLALVGVGYSNESRSKDGCLRLYTNTNPLQLISPILCLDARGSWWSTSTTGDAPSKIRASSRFGCSGS